MPRYRSVWVLAEPRNAVAWIHTLDLQIADALTYQYSRGRHARLAELRLRHGPGHSREDTDGASLFRPIPLAAVPMGTRLAREGAALSLVPCNASARRARLSGTLTRHSLSSAGPPILVLRLLEPDFQVGDDVVVAGRTNHRRRLRPVCAVLWPSACSALELRCGCCRTGRASGTQHPEWPHSVLLRCSNCYR